MSSRLYLGTDAPPISPTFTGAWTSTSGAVRRILEPAKFGWAALEALAKAGATAGAQTDYLIAQYVSAPLSGNQTITGTLKGQIRAQVGQIAAKAVAQVFAWVTQGDTSTSRGTLLAFNTTDASEFALALTNRKYPRGGAATLSSVAALDGDRIVIEIGWSKFENATTSRTATISAGNPSGTELPEDETTTAANTPWVEFSQTLTFKEAFARVTQAFEESLRNAPSLARVSQVYAEMLRDAPSLARVSQVYAEALIPVTSPTTNYPTVEVEWLD